MKIKDIYNKKNEIKKIKLSTNFVPPLVLFVLILILSLISKNFFSVNNLFNIAKQISVNLIIALGMTIIIINGGIDLSVGSILALSGCTMALLSTKYAFNPILAIFIGIIVGTSIGALNGFIISKTKTPAFIITLGMMSAAKGLSLLLTKGFPVTGLPKIMVYFGSGYIGFMPCSAIIAIIMSLIVWFILNYTMVGRNAYAIGGNIDAAISSGIDVEKNKIIFYAIGGFLCSIASLVQVGRIFSANSLMGTGKELTAIAAVIIGGTNLFGGAGTVLGTIIGTMIMGIISNGLNMLNVSSFLQELFMGLLIIIVVVLNQFKRKY